MFNASLLEWEELPCRICHTDITSMQNPSHMGSLMELPMWDRVCCVLGRSQRSPGRRLPGPLFDIYGTFQNHWLHPERVLVLGLTRLTTNTNSPYPDQDAAITHAGNIDIELEEWTNAWLVQDQQRLHYSLFRIDEKLDRLSPCRRDFLSDPSGNYRHLRPSSHKYALELLARVRQRLDDVVSAYEKNCPAMRSSVTNHIRGMSLKTRYIYRDILWKGECRIPTEAIPSASYDPPPQIHNGPPIELSSERHQGIAGAVSRERPTSPETPEQFSIGFTPINKRDGLSPQSSETLTSRSHNSPSPLAPLERKESQKPSDSSPSCTSGGSPANKNGKGSPKNGTSPSLSSDNSAKRTREREKGKGINEEGHMAMTPCDKCAASRNHCMVPRDPKRWATFKCGNCIKGQMGCSLSARNPGRDDYDTAYVSVCARREERREAARAKREQQKRGRDDGGGPLNPAGDEAEAERKEEPEDEERPRNKRKARREETEESHAEKGARDPSQDEPPKKKRIALPTCRPKKFDSSTTSPGIR